MSNELNDFGWYKRENKGSNVTWTKQKKNIQDVESHDHPSPQEVDVCVSLPIYVLVVLSKFWAFTISLNSCSINHLHTHFRLVIRCFPLSLKMSYYVELFFLQIIINDCRCLKSHRNNQKNIGFNVNQLHSTV